MSLRVFQGHFEVGFGLLSLDRWKSVEEPVERLAGFQIVDQGLNRNAGPGKHKFSAEDLGITGYDAFCVQRTVSAHR